MLLGRLEEVLYIEPVILISYECNAFPRLFVSSADLAALDLNLVKGQTL